MPIDSALVGSSTSVHRHDVDARWTMAFSAALGDTGPHYLDTTGEVVAHPLFTIAPEWNVHLEGRDQLAGNGLTPDERLKSVHATHDCHVHRLVRPGDRLDTRATVVLAEARRPGAYVVTRLDTTDASGEPVCTTYQASVYRGVAVAGGDRVHAEPPPPPAAASAAPNGGAPPLAEIPVPVAANLAHVYSECARVWNPIHTDVEVARKMGAPGHHPARERDPRPRGVPGRRPCGRGRSEIGPAPRRDVPGDGADAERDPPSGCSRTRRRTRGASSRGTSSTPRGALRSRRASWSSPRSLDSVRNSARHQLTSRVFQEHCFPGARASSPRRTEGPHRRHGQDARAPGRPAVPKEPRSQPGPRAQSGSPMSARPSGRRTERAAGRLRPCRSR